uniref:Uncharacterized protein n=1 Tax=Buteo japonicus TaxID=224669 RepID=A0A8C0B0Y1_9AVES
LDEIKGNRRPRRAVSVQNGSIHQKDAVNDDDFEPYLSSQTNQVSEHCLLS